MAAATKLSLPATADELALLRKGDPRKALLAALVRKQTGVGTGWIAERLGMGHPGSVSRLISAIRNDPTQSKELDGLAKMLLSGD